MAIFSFVVKWMKGIGFVFILFVSSYLLTSITFYSKGNKEEQYEIEPYYINGVEIDNLVNQKYIQIDVRLKEDLSNEILVAYAYSYFDEYEKEVHIYIIEEEKIVVINKNEKGIVKKEG